jgi:hypothetical protein
LAQILISGVMRRFTHIWPVVSIQSVPRFIRCTLSSGCSEFRLLLIRVDPINDSICFCLQSFMNSFLDFLIQEIFNRFLLFLIRWDLIRII